MISMLRKLLRAYRDAVIWYTKVVKVERQYDVPWQIRWRMYLKGFTADQYVRFDLEHNDSKDYLSEFERQKGRDINAPYQVILDNKYVFCELISRYIRVPATYAYISRGKIRGLGEHKVDDTSILDFLIGKPSVVVKPVDKGDGRGVCVVRHEAGTYYIDDKAASEDEMKALFAGYTDAILSEFMVQSAFSKSLFPKSTNTLRILTAKMPNGEYEILSAVQRVGNEISAPTDNLSRGGIVVQVDLETGELGRATPFYTEHATEQVFFTHHPDTGEALTGKQIPRWDELKQVVLDTASKLYFISFIAWDFLILEDGFCVIEGNASSGLNLFQVWGGQRNGPIGQAYRRFGVLK